MTHSFVQPPCVSNLNIQLNLFLWSDSDRDKRLVATMQWFPLDIITLLAEIRFEGGQIGGNYAYSCTEKCIV